MISVKFDRIKQRFYIRTNRFEIFIYQQMLNINSEKKIVYNNLSINLFSIYKKKRKFFLNKIRQILRGKNYSKTVFSTKLACGICFCNVCVVWNRYLIAAAYRERRILAQNLLKWFNTSCWRACIYVCCAGWNLQKNEKYAFHYVHGEDEPQYANEIINSALSPELAFMLLVKIDGKCVCVWLWGRWNPIMLFPLIYCSFPGFPYRVFWFVRFL